MKHNLWNLISCLKNGSLAKKAFTRHVSKKICLNVLQVLWDEGFIAGYKIDSQNKAKVVIFLKFNKNKEPAFSKIVPVSKPGKRIYYTCKQLSKINSVNTFVIVSTNKGLKSLSECKKIGLGGEPILAIS